MRLIHDYQEQIDGPQSSKDITGRTILRKSGGGGGDGGAAQREAERQARIASGTAAVNSIFGIGNDEAMKARNAMYDTTKEDTRKFFASQLDEDRAKAEREMQFAKARMGIIGSSQANDLDAEFQRRLDRGLLDVANRADSARTQFKNNDEQSRLNLISKVVAGIDQGTAAQNAMSTLQTNANAAKEAYQSQRMANVFQDMLGAYNTQQYMQGLNANKQQQNTQGNSFTASPYAGETSKS